MDGVFKLFNILVLIKQKISLKKAFTMIKRRSKLKMQRTRDRVSVINVDQEDKENLRPKW